MYKNYTQTKPGINAYKSVAQYPPAVRPAEHTEIKCGLNYVIGVRNVVFFCFFLINLFIFQWLKDKVLEIEWSLVFKAATHLRERGEINK